MTIGCYPSYPRLAAWRADLAWRKRLILAIWRLRIDIGWAQK